MLTIPTLLAALTRPAGASPVARPAIPAGLAATTLPVRQRSRMAPAMPADDPDTALGAVAVLHLD